MPVRLFLALGTEKQYLFEKASLSFDKLLEIVIVLKMSFFLFFSFI